MNLARAIQNAFASAAKAEPVDQDTEQRLVTFFKQKLQGMEPVALGEVTITTEDRRIVIKLDPK